jgi:hypothetical protein
MHRGFPWEAKRYSNSVGMLLCAISLVRRSVVRVVISQPLALRSVSVEPKYSW